MQNLRKYGDEPFEVAVIHGGPGAPGGIAPVARELSRICGVLEPLQTENSIEGQIRELKETLENNTKGPVILIGHSWGAWLSYILAAQYPQLVKKLILVGCGSFEEKYLSEMNTNRISRLSEEENLKVETLIRLLNNPNDENKKKTFRELGKLMTKADSFVPIHIENEELDFQPDVFQNCMKEVMYLRKSKKLLEMGNEIECPVIAIHGDYDSHAFEGVKKPLSRVIKDFKFHLLKDCGHNPWNELYAKNKFYEILNEELSSK